MLLACLRMLRVLMVGVGVWVIWASWTLFPDKIFAAIANPFTYDHRTMKIRLPVRSAIYKHCTGGLVVRWVTTSESPLLYVF